MNCTSEEEGDEMIVDQIILQIIIMTFVPATHYKCFLSASTLCGEGPHSEAIDVFTSESHILA